MKKICTTFFHLALLIGLSTSSQKLVAQDTQHNAVTNAKLQNFAQAELQKLEKKFNVTFGYKTDLLQGVKVKKIGEYATVEEALNALLKGLGLTFKKVGDGFYAIIPKPRIEQAKESSTQAQEVTSKIQHGIIKGIVKDINQKGIPGVSVLVVGSKIGTITTGTGNYTLKIPSSITNPQLVFSAIGYKEQTVAIQSQSIIDVVLTLTTNSLDQVIVVGYGTQKKKDLTGSIGTINADQMDKYPGGSINTSLQGKIAGLQITTNSGEPGAGANITLRGVSSVNGSSQPLIIIDGVPVNNDSYSSLGDGANFSPLSDIDPSNIESIEVLKDAASASIYGSRASNGVILITTKTGKGKIPEINFNSNVSSVKLGRKIGILNGPEWRSAYIDAIYNATGALTTKEAVIDSLHPYYRDSYNWQDILFRQATQYKADVSVRGASKDNDINYFVNFGYKNLKPIAVDTKYGQVYASFRLNYKINNFIKGATNFDLSNYNYNRILSSGSSSTIHRALITLPVYSPYDPITGALIPLFEGTKVNPLAQTIYSTNDIKRWGLLGKQELDFHLAKGLDFKSSLGLNYSNTETDYYEPPILSSTGSAKSIYTYYSPVVNNSIINENILTYQHSFHHNHEIDLLLGQSYQLLKSNNLSLRGQGSIDNQITTLSGAATINSFSQSLSEHALTSIFGRFNYNYKERYLLSMVLRRDGSSRFGADNQYGYFPAISAGWRFSDEPFFKSLKFLDDGKLRAGYGITGNESIGDYASQGSYAQNGSYLGSVAITANGLPNNNLKWETTKQTDLGMDLSFFKERITVTADIYLKNTYNLLFNVQIPDQTGYGSLPYNFGSLQNKGLDFNVSGIIIQKAVNWNATLTFGMNKNKITSLPGGADYRPNGISLARVGQPVGVFYGLKSLGVYASDGDNVYKRDAYGQVIPYRKGSATGAIYKGGDEIWQDVNGDGVINDDDLQIIGDPSPKFFGGLQSNISYKNFIFGLDFNYVYGNKIYNNLVNSIDGYQFDTNYTLEQLRRWKNQGDITDVPRLVKGDPMQNYATSSRFVEDGSFLRLQTISLAYQLPKNLVKHIGVKGVSVGISVINLLTWTAYSGYDPEVSAGTNPLEFGQDNGSFPKSKSFNLSLNIKF